MTRILRLLTASLAGAAFLAACGGGGSTTPADLADTTRSVANAQTLVQALDSAGMTDLMRTAPALTLLAPTDEALAPYADDLAELRQPGNREALEDFLKSHMLDGAVLAEGLQAAAAEQAAAESAGRAQVQAAGRSFAVRNLNGEELSVTIEGGKLLVEGVEVTRADIKAANGVLHQLKGPLVRPSVFSVIKRLPETSILEAAVKAAGLEATLRGTGTFTLFAPTDRAFAALLAELNLTGEQLLANKPLLTQVLTYHVLATRQRARDLDDGETLVTVEGQALTVDVAGTPRRPAVTLTDARGRSAAVVKTDLRARNGVVHLIDRVVLPTDRSVVQIAQSLPQFSLLVEAVVAAGLADTLSGTGPFTVFAPTNDAFVALLGELGVTKEALFANRPLLTAVLTYHVLGNQRTLAADLRDGATATTVQGQAIRFDLGGGAKIVDARGRVSNIVATNVQGANGVVHVIDKVLLPQAPEFRNLVEIARSLPQFSLLVEAVETAGLGATLSGPGPLTVFAPTNDAFVALLAELGVSKEVLFANRPLLTAVLTYHVLGQRVLAGDLRDELSVPTAQGQSITIDLDGGAKIRDARGRIANIVATDVLATNGVIHVIDRVILPRPETPPPPPPAPVVVPDLVQLAQSLPQFSILVEAVVAANLVDTLKAAGPFTVFAPTNAAFAALLAELGISKEALLANTPLLTAVLRYHVLAGQVLAGDLRDELAVATVNGQPVVVDLTGGPKLRDARGRVANITATDVLASNGVVHAIDRVILPTTRNLVQVALSQPQFSTLVAALNAAGLADTLTSGTFTVFAPTNEAFAALLHELHLTQAQLLANRTLLTRVLTYHVVRGQVLSSGIPFGQPIETVQGGRFTISASPLQITDARHRTARIVATDVAATNGVVHVIDRVILPPR
jgi:transforming growth factor-beta-induced protein